MIHETGSKAQSKDKRNGQGGGENLDAKTMPDPDLDDGRGGTVGYRRRQR